MHGKHSGQTCQAGEKEALSPRGGGGGRGGGRVGREKEEKKRVRVRVKVFNQEIINKK